VEVHHKHAPIKNWREFAKEVGIIVLGVLIALGGEQAVEALHHRAEVREAREALNEELGWNFASLKQSFDLSRCATARLDELERWQKSSQAGRPVRFSRPIAIVPEVAFRTSVWRVTTGDAVSRMPLHERTTYARLYDAIDLTQQQRSIVTNSWVDLILFQNARHLSDEQQLQITKDIEGIRALYGIMQSNYRLMSGDARAVGIVASDSPVFAENYARQQDMCRSLLAS
jgi:hypothetical protein